MALPIEPDHRQAVTGLAAEYQASVVDHRTPDEIIDCDEFGVPR
jgi:hypothetical protein